jgi:hypothetical protein
MLQIGDLFFLNLNSNTVLNDSKGEKERYSTDQTSLGRKENPRIFEKPIVFSGHVKKNVVSDSRPCKQGFLPKRSVTKRDDPKMLFYHHGDGFFHHQPELFDARILEGCLNALWRLFADPLLLAV